MPGLDVVGSTSDSEEGIRDIAGLSPDVVLIDTEMNRANGIDICRRALAANDRTKVTGLTSYLDPDERRRAYRAGVNGYLLKNVDTENLGNWIRLAVGRGTTEHHNLPRSMGFPRPPFSTPKASRWPEHFVQTALDILASSCQA